MDVIGQYARKQPAKPALVEGDRALTWAELATARNRLAHALTDLGLGEGEQAVIYSENSIEFLLAGAAARAVGAMPVPLNHRLTAEEAQYVLDDCDAAVVFVGDAFLGTFDAVRARVPKLRHVVTLGRERRPWAHALETLLDAGSPEPLASADAQGVGASMLYTAGTTGRPKGAVRGPIDPASTIPRLRALGVAEADQIHLVAGPLYHSAPLGFALYAQLFGATLVVMRKFEPEAALATIARHRCTTTFMAPTLVKRIVDLPHEVRARHDVSSMRAIVVAGAPCPMKVKEDATAFFGPVLYEFYGSTELGINTVLGPEDVLRKPGSCGRAAPGVEIALLDDEGQPVPAGTPGQLYVRRGAGVFEGYYKKPEASRDTTRGEWISVGDVARVDAEGFYYICDRKRDMIISGGVNVYPAEIEDVLHRHPKVADVAVFGVPDDEWGERVHAAVKVREGEALTADELIAFARRHLAGYKVPSRVSFHEAFPRDAAGKLLKRLLRDPYWAGKGRRI